MSCGNRETLRLQFTEQHSSCRTRKIQTPTNKIRKYRSDTFILHVDFVSQLKNRVDLTLVKVGVKAEALRITLNLDGTPITSKSHTHPSHSQTCNKDSKEQVFVWMTSTVKFNDCSSRGNGFQNYSKNWFVFFEENYFSRSVQC
jgi:hypothetical protein